MHALLAAYALLSLTMNAAGWPLHCYKKSADVSRSAELSALPRIAHWGGPFFEQGAAELILRLTGNFEAVLLGSPDLFMAPKIRSVDRPQLFWHGYGQNKGERYKLPQCERMPFENFFWGAQSL